MSTRPPGLMRSKEHRQPQPSGQGGSLFEAVNANYQIHGTGISDRQRPPKDGAPQQRPTERAFEHGDRDRQMRNGQPQGQNDQQNGYGRPMGPREIPPRKSPQPHSLKNKDGRVPNGGGGGGGGDDTIQDYSFDNLQKYMPQQSPYPNNDHSYERPNIPNGYPPSSDPYPPSGHRYPPPRGAYPQNAYPVDQRHRPPYSYDQKPYGGYPSQDRGTNGDGYHQPPSHQRQLALAHKDKELDHLRRVIKTEQKLKSDILAKLSEVTQPAKHNTTLNEFVSRVRMAVEDYDALTHSFEMFRSNNLGRGDEAAEQGITELLQQAQHASNRMENIGQEFQTMILQLQRSCEKMRGKSSTPRGPQDQPRAGPVVEDEKKEKMDEKVPELAAAGAHDEDSSDDGVGEEDERNGKPGAGKLEPVEVAGIAKPPAHNDDDGFGADSLTSNSGNESDNGNSKRDEDLPTLERKPHHQSSTTGVPMKNNPVNGRVPPIRIPPRDNRPPPPGFSGYPNNRPPSGGMDYRRPPPNEYGDPNQDYRGPPQDMRGPPSNMRRPPPGYHPSSPGGWYPPPERPPRRYNDRPPPMRGRDDRRRVNRWHSDDDGPPKMERRPSPRRRHRSPTPKKERKNRKSKTKDQRTPSSSSSSSPSPSPRRRRDKDRHQRRKARVNIIDLVSSSDDESDPPKKSRRKSPKKKVKRRTHSPSSSSSESSADDDSSRRKEDKKGRRQKATSSKPSVNSPVAAKSDEREEEESEESGGDEDPFFAPAKPIAPAKKKSRWQRGGGRGRGRGRGRAGGFRVGGLSGGFSYRRKM